MEKLRTALHFFYFSECGKWTLSDSVTAKLTGEDVELSADEKWQSLGYLLHLGDQTSCTVSIIGPRWIMTSHSCVSRYVFIYLDFLCCSILLVFLFISQRIQKLIPKLEILNFHEFFIQSEACF